ncbi:hypothetical protein LCGC14_1885880 [marine sediment metagenome]|uniref:Uncharacterized protein n=1 Tax=marine sediment metagenome TaxID=412755 RepID=A0A0F9IZ98_9ZZZZ
MKKCYIYVGQDNPPDYCPENFINRDDLVTLLGGRIENAFYSFGEKTIMNCPRCKVLTEATHFHDTEHELKGIHCRFSPLDGSERYMSVWSVDILCARQREKSRDCGSFWIRHERSS